MRIGIIGLGGYAADHWRDLRTLQAAGECRIVATAVIDPENHRGPLRALRAEGVQVFPSALAMLHGMRGRMDAVTIPTAIHTHAELMTTAVQSGYDVYLEKPPAATIQDVDRMLDALRATDRLCAVGFQALWSASMAFLKRRLLEGAIGRVTRVSVGSLWARDAGYYTRNEWAGRLRVGGAWVLDGTANNPLAHQVANVLYLAGAAPDALATPTAVRGELYAAQDIESEDTAALEIHTAEGPRCCFLATLCAQREIDPQITVWGEKGSAWRSYDGHVEIRRADGTLEAPALDDQGQFVERFRSFRQAVRTRDRRELRCHLEMCRPFTLAVNGAFESSGRVIRVDGPHVERLGIGAEARTIIRDIAGTIPRAARQCRLFSDIGVPWAQATPVFPLDGYAHFPARFGGAPGAARLQAGAECSKG